MGDPVLAPPRSFLLFLPPASQLPDSTFYISAFSFFSHASPNHSAHFCHTMAERPDPGSQMEALSNSVDRFSESFQTFQRSLQTNAASIQTMLRPCLDSANTHLGDVVGHSAQMQQDVAEGVQRSKAMQKLESDLDAAAQELATLKDTRKELEISQVNAHQWKVKHSEAEEAIARQKSQFWQQDAALREEHAAEISKLRAEHATELSIKYQRYGDLILESRQASERLDREHAIAMESLPNSHQTEMITLRRKYDALVDLHQKMRRKENDHVLEIARLQTEYEVMADTSHAVEEVETPTSHRISQSPVAGMTEAPGQIFGDIAGTDYEQIMSERPTTSPREVSSTRDPDEQRGDVKDEVITDPGVTYVQEGFVDGAEAWDLPIMKAELKVEEQTPLRTGAVIGAQRQPSSDTLPLKRKRTTDIEADDSSMLAGTRAQTKRKYGSAEPPASREHTFIGADENSTVEKRWTREPSRVGLEAGDMTTEEQLGSRPSEPDARTKALQVRELIQPQWPISNAEEAILMKQLASLFSKGAPLLGKLHVIDLQGSDH